MIILLYSYFIPGPVAPSFCSTQKGHSCSPLWTVMRETCLQIPLWLLSCVVNFPGSGSTGAAALESSKLCFANWKEQVKKTWSQGQACAGPELTASNCKPKVRAWAIQNTSQCFSSSVYHSGRIKVPKRAEQGGGVLRWLGYTPDQVGSTRLGHKGADMIPLQTDPITWSHNLGGRMPSEVCVCEPMCCALWVKS